MNRSPTISRHPRGVPAPGWGSLLIMALLLVGGCASMLSPEAVQPDETGEADLAASHDAAVLALTNWRLGGRIAIQRDDQGVSAGLDWRQFGDRFDLRISAPLNGGTFALQGNGDAVTLLTPAGETFSAANAEALLAEHLGWTLPVSGAAYWVRGIVAPGAAATALRRDASGRVTDFAQQGWRVSILAYGEDEVPALPRKLFLSRDTFKVRMAINQWERD